MSRVCPAYWLALTRAWRVRDKVSFRVWDAYAKRFPVAAASATFALSRLTDSVLDREDPQRWQERQTIAQRLLDPKHLLAACVIVSPEGARRDPGVRRLEAALLAAMSPEGHWRGVLPHAPEPTITDSRQWHQLQQKGVHV